MIWHPRCFSCSACDELLVDLTYCVHDDKIFCERHYAEMLKPRCNACDEVSNVNFNFKFNYLKLIYQFKSTTAEARYLRHFICRNFFVNHIFVEHFFVEHNFAEHNFAEHNFV